MTDRINYLTVALTHDMRVDDIDALVTAIRMLKGVLAVEPHVATSADWIGELRARETLRDKLRDVLWP